MSGPRVVVPRVPMVRIRATFDAYSWHDECAACGSRNIAPASYSYGGIVKCADCGAEETPNPAEDPDERRGWVDPRNPWGSFEQNVDDDSCEPAAIILPIYSAAEFLRDFPGGLWGHSESEAEQNVRTGEWKSVTAHVDGAGADAVLELLDRMSPRTTGQDEQVNDETHRYTAHHYPRTGEPPMSYRYVLTAPLIIGPRLMPALQLDDRSTLHLEFAGRDDEGRCTTRLVIDDADGATIYDGTGPSSGCDADPDIRDMFAAACDFLAAEAETYRVDMGTREPDDGWLFNARVAEWGYMHDDELQLAASELQADDDMGEYISRCPACGDPIDYCQGHGEMGDPAGWAILEAHDDGDHRGCDPAGCDDAPDA